MSDPAARPARPARSDSREAQELRAIRERQPELASAVDLHLDLIELHRRIQGRVPLPWFELSADIIARHNSEGRPLLRFEDIPLELTDLRLLVRQTADVLRRHGALDENDSQQVQTLGRDMTLLVVAGNWYRAGAERHAVAGFGSLPPTPAGAAAATPAASHDESPGGMLDQVLTLAMRPFLVRCTEVLQQRPDLSLWTHSHCALCGSEPDFSVITPAAERHLICARCWLRWKFEPLTCPYCHNRDRAKITSFATSDGRYRVYACDICRRYLKAYDARRATRPMMPMVDAVATLPLDAAAQQRGYTG